MDKDQMIRALKDIGAFILICALGWLLINMFSGCKSVPAQVVDNSTVTTETTRTEYAPDGSVLAIEVQKEVVQSDVVVEPNGVKEKKKRSVPWWLPVFLVLGVAGGSWYFFKNLPRKI